MHTISVNVYSYNELSEKAKERAINYFKDSGIFYYQDDAINTIKAIAKALNCEYDYYSYDGIYYKVEFISNSEIEELQGKRAYSYIVNNYIIPNLKFKTYYRKCNRRISNIFSIFDDCLFTGYYLDMAFNEAWKNWKKSFNSKSKVKDFLHMVETELGSEWSIDNEYQMKDENIIEQIEINDYEFYENGDVYRD